MLCGDDPLRIREEEEEKYPRQIFIYTYIYFRSVCEKAPLTLCAVFEPSARTREFHLDFSPIYILTVCVCISHFPAANLKANKKGAKKKTKNIYSALARDV